MPEITPHNAGFLRRPPSLRSETFQNIPNPSKLSAKPTKPDTTSPTYPFAKQVAQALLRRNNPRNRRSSSKPSTMSISSQLPRTSSASAISSHDEPPRSYGRWSNDPSCAQEHVEEPDMELNGHRCTRKLHNMPIHEKCPEFRVKEYIDKIAQAYFNTLQYDELEFECIREATYFVGTKAIDEAIRAYPPSAVDEYQRMRSFALALMEFKGEALAAGDEPADETAAGDVAVSLATVFAAEDQLRERFYELAPSSKHRYMVGLIMIGRYFKPFLIDTEKMAVYPPFAARSHPHFSTFLTVEDEAIHQNNPYLDWTQGIGQLKLLQVFADIVGIGLGARDTQDVGHLEQAIRLNRPKYFHLYDSRLKKGPDVAPGSLSAPSTPSVTTLGSLPSSSDDGNGSDSSYVPSLRKVAAQVGPSNRQLRSQT